MPLELIARDAEMVISDVDVLGAVRSAGTRGLRVEGRPRSAPLKGANGSGRAVATVGLVERSNSALIDTGIHRTLLQLNITHGNALILRLTEEDRLTPRHCHNGRLLERERTAGNIV
jgi:hypothetical protein